MRRVMAEFLCGGNIRKALNEELYDKELVYERDPKLRHTPDGNAISGAGVSNPGSIAAALGMAAASSPSSPATLAPDKPANYPVPDETTLKTLRRKQAAAVVAATLATGVAIAFLVAMMA